MINGQKNTNKIAFNTTKLELENYLHHDAILEGYRSNGINDLNLNELTDTMDVPLYIAEKMNRRTNNNWDTLDEDKREELASDKKKFLNTIAVEHMTIERIKNRNSYNDLVQWFNTIRGFIN